jgi:hypothetical protein
MAAILFSPYLPRFRNEDGKIAEAMTDVLSETIRSRRKRNSHVA